jgi:putative restriction endonuclease
MFDRGLISVAEDCETILVSRNKVPGEVVQRLLRPDCKLWKPADPRKAPHPANLKWHRENVFGQGIAEGPLDWG